jgi:methionyl-tRNA formyltransferase
LLQEKFPIGENETVGEVHDRMMGIGAVTLVKTVQGLAEGTLTEVPQESMVNKSIVNGEWSKDEALKEMGDAFQPSTLNLNAQTLHHAPKIFTETCNIDWRRSIDEIHNLIRGLSPFPCAFTELGDKTIKIFRGEKELSLPTSKPGRWESDGKTYLKFAAKDGYILLKDVQLEGKKRMLIEDFLRGYRFG